MEMEKMLQNKLKNCTEKIGDESRRMKMEIDTGIKLKQI